MRLLPAFLILALATPLACHAADIVIGAVYPAGADARHAVDTALDIVNGTHERIPVLMGQGGGLDRLGGVKLTVAFADDPGDPARAADGAERLITDDHAQALIGGLSDASAAAISRVAEHHGIPFLSLDSALTNTDGLTWFFRIGRTPAGDNIGILKLLGVLAAANKGSLDTVAIVFGDSPAGRDRTAPLRKAAEAAHLKLVEVPAATDADAAARTIAAAAPNAVLFELGGPLEATLLAQLSASGTGPLVLMQRNASSTIEGVFRSTSYVADKLPARPAVSEVDAAYRAKAGKPLDPAAARELTGVLLLADVINRAASTKPIDLRTALMATDTPGGDTLMLWDGIRFDDTGQNVLATPALQQLQHGIFQLVAPDPVATAPAIWPAPK